MKTVAVALLCLVAIGCGITPTEGDRLVVDQTVKAAQVLSKQLDLIAAIAGEQAVAEARQIVADILANGEYAQKLLGLPKEPKPYSKGNSAAARNQATEEHSSGAWWYGVGMTALTIAGVIGRRILAAYIPWLATPTERANDANIAGIAKARSESTVVKVGDQEIDMIPVAKLDGHLVAEQLRAKVKSFVAAKAKEIEDGLRLEPKSV